MHLRIIFICCVFYTLNVVFSSFLSFSRRHCIIWNWKKDSRVLKAIHYAFPYVFTLYYKRFISRSFSTFLLFPSRLLKFYNLQRKGSESLGSRSLCMHVCIYLVFISRYKPSALLSFLSSSSTFYNLEKERYQSVLEAFHCTCTYTFILHCKRFNSLFSLILSSRFLFPSFFFS